MAAPVERDIPISADGPWSIDIGNEFQCDCGREYGVTAWCLENEDCRDTRTGLLECPPEERSPCPSISITTLTYGECDTAGQRSVTVTARYVSAGGGLLEGRLVLNGTEIGRSSGAS